MTDREWIGGGERLDQLVIALRRRIRAFLNDNDPLPVFEPRAMAEAAELWEAFAARAEAVPVEAAHTLAWFHWSRWLALPNEAHREDLIIAQDFFSMIVGSYPELVPPELRTLAEPDREGRAYDGARILNKFTEDNDPADLEMAIDLLEQGIDATPDGHPHLAVHLHNLANGYRMRFERTGAQEDLDAAVLVARQALRTGSFADFGADSFLHTLEYVVDKRYKLFRGLEDLDELIRVMRDRLVSTASDDPEWALRAGRLAETLLMRFDRTNQGPDLDEAIAVGKAALTGDWADDADRQLLFGPNLAISLNWRYERSGDRADLEDAVASFRQALAVIPDDAPSRNEALSNFGGILNNLFTVSGADSDLTEAIALGRAAVEAMPDRGAGLANLAVNLRTRFERAGSLADLDESIQLARAAAAADHAGEPNYGAHLSVLSVPLQMRFEHIGRLEDLDESVSVGRSAVQALPEDHPGRVVCLGNFVGALRTRFLQRGELSDLQEAIEIGRAAVADAPVGHMHRPMCLGNLALALHDRFVAIRDPADLDEAAVASRAAADSLGPSDRERSIYLIGLCRILRSRYQHARRVSDLDGALEAARTAVAVTTDDDPGWPIRLHELSVTLRQQFTHTEAAADLDEALRYARLAVDACPSGNPNRAGYLYHLGNLLETRAQPDRAVDAWTEAAGTSAGAMGNRIAAARAWGDISANHEQWSRAWEGYAMAVSLIPLQAWRGIHRTSRERWLSDWMGLATDAAACAIAAGPADEAVQLLELGRGVLWAQLLETRTDLAALGERAPELADRLQRVRAALDYQAEP